MQNRIYGAYFEDEEEGGDEFQEVREGECRGLVEPGTGHVGYVENGSGHGSEKRGTGCGGRSRGEEVSPVEKRLMTYIRKENIQSRRSECEVCGKRWRRTGSGSGSESSGGSSGYDGRGHI